MIRQDKEFMNKLWERKHKVGTSGCAGWDMMELIHSAKNLDALGGKGLEWHNLNWEKKKKIVLVGSEECAAESPYLCHFF